MLKRGLCLVIFQLIGRSLPTLWRIIWSTKSTNLNVSLSLNDTMIETSTLIFDTVISKHCGPARFIHKINYHSRLGEVAITE